MYPPASVTKGVAPAILSFGSPKRDSSRAVEACPKRSTSTGTGQRTPRRGESFDRSTIRMFTRADWLTIFSRVRAPPPPLMTLSEGSTSSAPSTQTSMDQGPSSLASGIPSFPACSRLCAEVGTPT
jgi:hypothetical protein